MCLLFDEMQQVPADSKRSHNSEHTQKQFPERPAQLNAVSHSIVLRKMNLKPMRNVNLLTNVHMRLHPDLYNLINEKNCKDDDSCAFQEDC